MHKIAFINRENDWSNGLPMGNGVFGGLIYYQKNELTLGLNHYEVHYNISDTVLPEELLRETQVSDPTLFDPTESDAETSFIPGTEHRLMKERADANAIPAGEPFYHYRHDKRKGAPYAVGSFSGSYPTTGNLVLALEPSENTELRLDIEAATIHFSGDRGTIETIVSREDCVLTKVTGQLVKEIRMDYPAQRDLAYPEVSWEQLSETSFCWKVKLNLNRKARFCGIVKLSGAVGRLKGDTIEILKTEPEFRILTGVFTEWQHEDPLTEGLMLMESWDPEALVQQHQEYWTDFFSRSKLQLPDPFLEKIYLVNQYALDCCSGKDGVMKHHACGLNGLWDVKHPTLWGSMWYWDVNIQAAFAGVFSSNRTDLGEVFADGLLSYVELAERFAHDYHGMQGAAMDYPYAFYYSVWPWCAGYLWDQYQYTLDREFLKEKAYPLFLKLCRFALEAFTWDEKRGCYDIYPDISPEQGALAHNTVITIASVKYMLSFTLEAAQILGQEDPLLQEIRELRDHLPEYPISEGPKPHFLDAEGAPENLWIRHPSMLMPVFPTGEIDRTSDPKLVELVDNTIAFLEDNCEIGVFQVSWLAAAAARIGQGQKALRLLYEMGIDQLIRSNGLAAEENERFLNYCLLCRQPLYYPCMMEFTGEMLAAVNEMLLQSHNGVIRLFPAIPDGDPEYDRMIRRGWSLHEYEDRFAKLPAWNAVRFDRMLARGAFEISAELKDGEVIWLRILAKKGGKAHITSPFLKEDLYLELEEGEVYEAGSPTNDVLSEDAPVMAHRSFTKRLVYLGEDPETEYQKKFDAFFRDWYLGNVRMENRTMYKFDFGLKPQELAKDYEKDIPSQIYGGEAMCMHSVPFVRPQDLEFSVFQGFGFTDPKVAAVDRGGPDELRRDFVYGETDNVFEIEVPAGQYDLLVISGDPEADTVTKLEAEHGRSTGGAITRKGRHQCSILPVVLEEDGHIRLKVSTEPGYRWVINGLIVNLTRRF